MRKLMIAGASAFLMSVPAMADDCWITDDKPTGWSVSSDRNYAFIKDGAQNMVICFGENDGTVMGDSLQYVKVGQSTLVGWGTNEVGLEVVSVVQIDRINRKLRFTLNRIGTVRIGSAMPIRVDRAGLFTADVLPVAHR